MAHYIVATYNHPVIGVMAITETCPIRSLYVKVMDMSKLAIELCPSPFVYPTCLVGSLCHLSKLTIVIIPKCVSVVRDLLMQPPA